MRERPIDPAFAAATNPTYQVADDASPVTRGPRRAAVSGVGADNRRRAPAARASSPDPRQRAAPPARGSGAGAPPPGGLQRDEIEQRASTLDDQTYFQILGVAPSAGPKDIQAAYFQLAKRWHPDRLHASLADLRPKVAAVFARISEANQTLSNADKRAEYEETVRQGGGTARDREMVERVIDSAMLFQKGEVMFRKGSYKQAEQMVKEAVDADPDQPEYLALLAWIQTHVMGKPPEDAQSRRHFYRDQIKMLDAVVAKEPDYERALFYRGQLLKRSGFEEMALRDFKKVAKLNPRNIDAAREVRLSKLRNKKEEKGLLGRFFNKDK